MEDGSQAKNDKCDAHAANKSKMLSQNVLSM
jgi:hypothetical protein